MNEKQIAMLRESIQKQIDILERAMDDLDQGYNTDIKGMEGRVNTLCMNIVQAGRETGMALEPDIKRMIARLDALEHKLHAHRAALVETIEKEAK